MDNHPRAFLKAVSSGHAATACCHTCAYTLRAASSFSALLKGGVAPEVELELVLIDPDAFLREIDHILEVQDLEVGLTEWQPSVGVQGRSTRREARDGRPAFAVACLDGQDWMSEPVCSARSYLSPLVPSPIPARRRRDVQDRVVPSSQRERRSARRIRVPDRVTSSSLIR
jgi:hypothetical protein